MATKSKSSRTYQTNWKFIYVILFILCASVLFFVSLVSQTIYSSWNSDIFRKEQYYDTRQFDDTLCQALDTAVLVDVHYQTEERISAGEFVDREELISGFKRYYNIIDGIIAANTQINETYDGLIIYNEIPERLSTNFEEYKQLVESRLPAYRQMYIQNQLDEFKNARRTQEGYRNFRYYVEDGRGKVVAGNASRTEVNGLERTLVLASNFSSDYLSESHHLSYENEHLTNSEYRIFAGIRDPFLPGDIFYTQAVDFEYGKNSLPILFGTFTIAALFLFLSIVNLIRVAGQREKDGEIQYIAVDRIYSEISFLFMITVVMASLHAAKRILQMSNTGNFWDFILLTILGFLYMINVTLLLTYVLSVARLLKGKRLFRNTWIFATVRRVTSLFTETTFRGWLLIMLLFFALGNCAIMGLLVLTTQQGYYALAILSAIFLLVFNLLSLYFLMRGLRSLKRIMISARETSKGNIHYQMNLDEISPSFLNFATDIANIQDGLKNAVEEAVKGERMKAELITNVSHDLKTPLTSIITYADLLQHEPSLEGRAKEYAEVLHDKSYRLKYLIEDLIEASKASSGNLNVSSAKMDYYQLLLQAIGEMEEKIEDAQLTFKLSCPERIYIYADGGHMWRIMENLLTNAVKYSMAGSRVYVDIFSAEGYGVLIMKNVSATPLDFDASRLTERFVRGDTARTTEGSGLGLSITESLTEIQGGSFGIEVDGDLFKAIVRIPLWAGDAYSIEEDIFVENDMLDGDEYAVKRDNEVEKEIDKEIDGEIVYQDEAELNEIKYSEKKA